MSVLGGSCLLLLNCLLFFVSGRLLNNSEIILEWNIVNFWRVQIIFIMIFDYISIFFISLVRLISGAVLIFRVSYIRREKYFSRFLMIVLFFVLSIYLLILSPNLISLLLGWDGLGVTSYLLVIFYQRNKSYNAGIITALTNRLGDVGLLICVGGIIYLGDWNFVAVANSNLNFNNFFLVILVISACTKRAQIPFSAWLPAAMAAPTPVSALVHSSTLVTAGVYLLIRFNYIIINSNYSYYLIIVGTFTMLIAGLAAILEIDIKKIIALSTLSQLGVIIIILGAQKPNLAYFHLLSHAYFKAILFMCAGIIIHNIKDYQDIRTIGNTNRSIPIIVRVVNTANISLCGLPFIRGFYSKDLILETILLRGVGGIELILLLVATLLTVIYSCRLSFLVSNNSINYNSLYFTRDKDFFIILGMFLLFPFSITGGMLISWNLFNVPTLIFIPFWIKSALLIFILLIIGLIIFLYKNMINIKSSTTSWFIRNMWFTPLIFSPSLTIGTLIVSKQIIKNSEISWIEIILYLNVFNFFKKINKYIEFYSNGYTINFVIIFLIIYVIIN